MVVPSTSLHVAPPDITLGAFVSSPDIYATPQVSSFDRRLHALLGKLTGGISPAALSLAAIDWLLHLLIYPGQHAAMAKLYADMQLQLLDLQMSNVLDYPAPAPLIPTANDTRFTNNAWQEWPYNFYVQAFLRREQWWQQFTTSIRGVGHHHRDLLSFIARQLTDMQSPSNFPATSPEIQQQAMRMMGTNFVIGGLHWLEDYMRQLLHKQPAGSEKFRVGVEVAITAGAVIMRNNTWP